MGVGSGGQGAMPHPLDFQTWYKYSRDLKVLFFGLFCYFSVFFPLAPLEEAKQCYFPVFFLASFQSFFRWLIFSRCRQRKSIILRTSDG